MPRGWAGDRRALRFFEHSSLHFHVDFQIDVSCVDIGVSEPITDHVDFVSGSQQMHRRRMTDGVWINVLRRNRRTRTLSCRAIFADNIPNAETRNGVTVRVEEQAFLAAVLGGAPVQIRLKSFGSFGPERTTAMLLALTEKRDLWGVAQT